MNIEIKNRYNGNIIVCGEYESIKDCLEKNMGGTPLQKNLLALQGAGDDLALRDAAASIATEIEQRHQMSVGQIIATNRHNFARGVAAEVVKKNPGKKNPKLQKGDGTQAYR